MPGTTVQVAVIGSGLSGLTAAYLLSSLSTNPKCKFIVHLFEKAPSLGMDAYSISVVTDTQGEQRIDVPMRSFQGGYYKQLIAFYRHLGIEFRTTDFTYSLSLLKRWINEAVVFQTYLLYNGSSGTKGISLPADNFPGDSMQDSAINMSASLMFALGTISLIFNYVRLIILSLPIFWPPPSTTFQQWLTQTTPNSFIARWLYLDKSWMVFNQYVLVPIFSAVCTAPEENIYTHPMEEFLEYIWMTLGSHHYAARHGVSEVVSRLSQDIAHKHLSTTITSIVPDPEHPSKLSIQTTERTFSGFSHVILATQANSAVPLLNSYCASLPPGVHHAHYTAVKNLTKCLKSFHYCKTIVTNHTDDRFVPPIHRNRRDLNLVWNSTQLAVEEGSEATTLPTSYTMATHVLSHLKTGKPIYQTTNPIVAPHKDFILSTTVLERAVVTTKSKKSLQQLSISKRDLFPFGSHITSLGPLQGTERLKSENVPGIWVCGSYAHKGIPLLEGCVASARDVVEKGVFKSEGIRLQEKPW